MYIIVINTGFDLGRYREFTMKKWAFGLALAVLLSSCADFFTNSWGKNAARDPGTITVTSANVKELLRAAKGDTKTSRGILDKIAGQLKNNPNPALQAAAVTAANQAAGLGTAALDKLGKVKTDDVDAFSTVLKEIQGGAEGSDLPGISNAITASLPTTVSGPDIVFAGDFVKNVSDSDLTMLTLTLVLAESEKAGDFDTYINGWTTPGGKTIDTNSTTALSPSEKVIAAAVNELAARPSSELGGMLKDLLGQK
jgi:hypothetical protein